jgi:hypothetical protein
MWAGNLNWQFHTPWSQCCAASSAEAEGWQNWLVEFFFAKLLVSKVHI